MPHRLIHQVMLLMRHLQWYRVGYGAGLHSGHMCGRHRCKAIVMHADDWHSCPEPGVCHCMWLMWQCC